MVARLNLPLDKDRQFTRELELSPGNFACFLLILLYSETRGEVRLHSASSMGTLN